MVRTYEPGRERNDKHNANKRVCLSHSNQNSPSTMTESSDDPPVLNSVHASYKKKNFQKKNKKKTFVPSDSSCCKCDVEVVDTQSILLKVVFLGCDGVLF